VIDVGDFLAQPIRWLKGNEFSDGFAKDDLGPGVWELALILRDVAQKLTRARTGHLARRRSERPVGV
jgi:hypothetical protein